MNIRSAILAAADHIEANPGEYDFYRIFTPTCGTPACMWGWIGHFLGMPAGTHNMYVAREVGVVLTDHLYDFCGDCNLIISNGQDVPEALRAYADKYFPASPSLDPAYVSWRDALEVEHGYARSGADG